LYLAIGSSTLHAYKEYTEPYPSAQLSPIPFSRFFDSFNGLRYAPSGHRWAGVDNAWEQRKLKTRKMLEMPQNPQRPVHALLGVPLVTRRK
jgi:hypothetical protein